MTKRTVVLVFCDMPHNGEEVEAETVTIEADRTTTQVDLCPACRSKYLGDLTSAGRLVRRPGPKPRR